MPETPYTYSDNVYAAFGRAAHAAQLLEKQLATFLLLPEFAKKGKISTATFAKVQEDLDKTPLGPLVNEMKSVVQPDEMFEKISADGSYPGRFLRYAHAPRTRQPRHLTNRWSQPLAVVMSTFDFMKQFSMFATLAAASGGSAPSR